MQFTQRLFGEALVVGFILAIMLVIAFKMQGDTLGFTADQVALSGFGVGLLFHLLAEAVGVNKWYCQNGNACNPY